MQTTDGYKLTDGYGSTDGYSHQINIRLNDNDYVNFEAINKYFFEGEASNSMLGRILVKKGINFYNQLKDELLK